MLAEVMVEMVVVVGGCENNGSGGAAMQEFWH